MNIFCSDLDNTLIYSWRRVLRGEKRCVEWLDGREISFMTARSLELLRELQKKVVFIPVTTRRTEQYARLSLPEISPPYVLTCNGGVLLENGKMDKGWYRESLELVGGCRKGMEKAKKFLMDEPSRNFELWFIQELFLFTKSEYPEETKKKIQELLDGEKIDVFTNKSKIYVLPQALNKGTAVERIRKRLNPEIVFAAGDSAFDVPMLERADIAYWGGEEPFSEEMLEYFLRESIARESITCETGRKL